MPVIITVLFFKNRHFGIKNLTKTKFSNYYILSSAFFEKNEHHKTIEASEVFW